MGGVGGCVAGGELWQILRMRRPPPPGLRPVRYAYAPPSVEKLLGSLPVVAEFCRRLDVAGIVDRACPVREVARVTHGQVIEALVANRLTSPRPLLRVEDWARQWAVEEVFGLAADALNDDRIGRALDAMAPQLAQVVGSVGARAIAVFGVDVARLHWDMTSISLYGVYDEAEAGFAAPRWGKPKDRRPDLKQVQTGLAVSGDGGVPVWHRAYDGGAGEVAQVVGAMTALKELAGTRKTLLVGDSKLISRGNILAMNTARVAFIAPAGRPYLPAAQLRALDPAAATPVDYLAERDQDLPAEQRGSYRVVEGGITLKAKRKAEQDLAVRCVFVWSSARAQAAARSRAKKLDRAGADLQRVQRGLGGPHYRTPAKVAERVAAIARRRKVTAFLRAQADTDPASGKPTLSWWFDQAALDAEAATDGWYGLLTNLAVEQADAAEVLRRYKGQEVVERRYGAFKGPLGVTPMFLKDNRRIAALISVICLALLVFCLVERAVRKAIAPAVELAGLYVGRPAKPTGRLIFEALARLRLNPAIGPDPPTIPTPPPLQAKLLELLNVDPTRPRWAS
jgi:transposase